jgi:hypothetical protein
MRDMEYGILSLCRSRSLKTRALAKYKLGLVGVKDTRWLVSMAEQSEACTVYDRLNIEITGLNPARDIDVCLHVSVLCSDRGLVLD